MEVGGLPGQVASLGDPCFLLPRAGLHSEMRQDPEGKWLAVPDGETVAVFDARTGALARSLTGHSDRVHAVAFSQDGRSLAGGNLAGAGKPYVIKVWDLQTGRETASLQGGPGMFWAISFDPEGKRLFCFGEKGLDVWDLAARKIVRWFPAGEGAYGFYSFGLNPDGKKLAWGGCAGEGESVGDRRGQGTGDARRPHRSGQLRRLQPGREMAGDRQ
jgi:WD40 repeat protein